MGPKEFAEACRDERDILLSTFTDTSVGTTVGANLAVAGLTPSQFQYVVTALETALTDTFYKLLLSLDGAASLGGSQRSFVLTDGNGSTIANGDGSLEAAAYDAFHGE